MASLGDVPEIRVERRRAWPHDLPLHGLTAAAAALAAGLVGLLTYKVFSQAHEAISAFGLKFLTGSEWNPVTNVFGARDLIWGTAITSVVAIILAVPVSIAIALFLTELAPRRLREPIGALVELLAAIPSVVLGLWGILVMGPFVADHIEPALKSTLGFLPLFSGTPSIEGILPACLVLTIMIVPIVSSISRELFLIVPGDLKEGSLALGSTRWEMVRSVMLPEVAGGLVAATVLGFGRAAGEAIAVTQVIGGTAAFRADLFGTGDTLASRIADQYQGAATSLQISALAYLAAILLVISLIANTAARLVVRQVERRQGRRI